MDNPGTSVSPLPREEGGPMDHSREPVFGRLNPSVNGCPHAPSDVSPPANGVLVIGYDRFPLPCS